MAVKPTDQSDVFLREVDEELRREQISNFFTRYGWWVIGAVLLLIAAIGGYLWWQEQRRSAAAEQGVMLVETMKAVQAGNRAAAQPKVDQLVESNIEGYRVAGLFARADLQVEANQIPQAVATLRSIAESNDFAEPYRQAALIRQTQLEFDNLAPQAVVQRLGPLAQAGQPFFGTAGELVAIAWLKAGQPNRAAPIFAAVARDEEVPPSIRQRAVQMAGSLGVNAVAEPAATNTAGAIPTKE